MSGLQGIKKVLNENFLSDEGMQPQAVLFKNLWLEAEAKLCSLSYKSRFDRMKIEMEKHKFIQGKGKSCLFWYLCCDSVTVVVFVLFQTFQYMRLLQ